MEPAFTTSSSLTVGSTSFSTRRLPLDLSSRRPTPLVLHDNENTHMNRTLVPTRRSNIITMVSPTNIAKKAEKVDKVKQRLSDSLLIFSVPLDGLKVSDISNLKQRMPDGSSIMTVKNTLMRRAIDESVWAPAEALTKTSTAWVFVKEDMKGTIKIYKDFLKETGREAPIRGGVFEGTHYDEVGIETVAALPNKEELITKIAISIKAIPTKIAKSIKQVPTKVGRAVKLACADEEAGNTEGDS